MDTFVPESELIPNNNDLLMFTIFNFVFIMECQQKSETMSNVLECENL